MHFDALTLVTADRTCDCIVGLSTVSSIVNIFIKVVVLPFLTDQTIEKNFYLSYLKEKSLLQCIALLVPGVSFAVFISRWNNKCKGEALVAKADLIRGLKDGDPHKDFREVDRLMKEAAEKYYHPRALAQMPLSKNRRYKFEAAVRGDLNALAYYPRYKEIAAYRGDVKALRDLMEFHSATYRQLAIKSNDPESLFKALTNSTREEQVIIYQKLKKIYDTTEQAAVKQETAFYLGYCVMKELGCQRNSEEGERLLRESDLFRFYKLQDLGTQLFDAKEYRVALIVLEIVIEKEPNLHSQLQKAKCLFAISRFSDAKVVMSNEKFLNFIPALEFLKECYEKGLYGYQKDPKEVQTLGEKIQILKQKRGY